MTLYSEIQQLEPGAWVDLFILDASAITGSGADVVRFHGYGQVGAIVWRGVSYSPWPLQAEGFALDPSRPSRPTLTVANVDGSISALCRRTDDMAGARLERHRTLGKYLDGQPGADPSQDIADTWFIERKASETAEAVQFELASAMEFGNVQLPRRRIIANVCAWKYRGAECGYTGGPVALADDSPTNKPGLDVCGKRLSSCRLRFGADSPLPFGSFPAAQLTR